MKTILRFSGLAALCLIVLAFSSANAQEKNPCEDADAIAALDGAVRANFKKNETVGIAITAAKEFLQKYGECPTSKDLAAWIRPQMSDWEKRDAAYRDYLWRKPRLEKFDDAIKNNRFDEVYAVGAELVRRYPDNVQNMMPLALIGLYESYKNNFKYNDETIKYAKVALSKLKNGNPEPKKDKDGKDVFGPLQFQRSKEDAISELTYALAYILYHAKKDKRAGLLYYYEVSQMPGPYKEEPRLYATIGQYYADEADPIGKEIVSLIEKQKTAPTDEEKAKLDVDIKAKEALFNGYLERSMDAYSRAYKFYDESVASEKTLKTQVYKILQDLYGRREPPAEFGKWIAGVSSVPLPDPTSAVAPVYDPEPVKKEPEPAEKPAAAKSGAVKTTPARVQKPAVRKPKP